MLKKELAFGRFFVRGVGEYKQLDKENNHFLSYEAAKASSCFCKSSLVSHRPRTITPAHRLMFATDLR
jgi:hypothetical protein